jgi:hypothetical protein
MALIIENGTGLADADSYEDVEALDEYVIKRGLVVPDALTDEDKEAALRDATEYADTYRRYKGIAKGPDQALMFPRTDLTDWSGYVITGVPSRLKQAVLYLAVLRLQGETLYEPLGREIASESVGPLSTSYVAGSNRHREFTTADRLLAQYVRDANRLQIAPGWTAPDRGHSFDRGMHDLSSARDDLGPGYNELTGDQ